MPTYDEWKHINESRANYINRRNLENANVETLTEDQHEALQYVCSARHALHVGHEDMFYSSRSNYKDLWDYLDSDSEMSINASLEKVGLSKIDGIDLDRSNYETDNDWFDLMDDDERAEYNDDINEWIDEVYPSLANQLNKINSKIENYLENIDKEHGTNYRPSGSQRLY